MVMTGHAVAFMDIARPWMIFVPWPETEASAMDWTGLYFVEV